MSLIVGDINANHTRWETNTSEDVRSEQLADEFDGADWTILSENETTRLLKNGRSTSPEICLTSNDIAHLSDLSVSTSQASDHLPILITINSELSTIDGSRRTYISVMKADWARYADACDEYLAEARETRTFEHTEKTFRKAVNKASGLFIPAGRIQHFQPTLPASAKSLADERDRKSGLNPIDAMLIDLNKQIQKTDGGRQANQMAIRVDKCNHRTGISHLWRLVKGLSGKKRSTRPSRASGSTTRPTLTP